MTSYVAVEVSFLCERDVAPLDGAFERFFACVSSHVVVEFVEVVIYQPTLVCHVRTAEHTQHKPTEWLLLA